MQAQQAQSQTNPQMAAMEAQIKALADQNAKLVEQGQRDRDRADADRRERELVARLDKQESEIKAKLEAIATKPTGPDPMMVMLIDVMKSSQQQSQIALERSQQNILKPSEIIAMTRESNNGVDEMKRTMTGLFTDVIQMQRQVTEQAMNMQPQGDSGTVRLIEGGIVALKEGFEKYGSGKAAVEMSQHKAVAAQANANAEVMRAQQVQMQLMAQREAAALQAQAQAQLLAAEQAKGALEGVVISEQHVPGNGTNGAAPSAAEPGAVVAAATKPVIEVVDATGQPLRYGKTDLQWFGPAMSKVNELRAGVAKYIKNINAAKPKLDPKTHQPLGVQPEQAARAIMTAADQIVAMKVEVPAFQGLYLEGRMDEFMEILLPDVIYQYRSDVAGMILSAYKKAHDEAEAQAMIPDQDGDPDGGDGGGDEDPDARDDA